MPLALEIFLGLTFLALIHEAAHFAAARAFGVRVERFQLFFQPWFALLPAVKIGGTEFRLGWLPLGAYVKFARPPGDPLPEPPLPWELRAKPPWQRLVVFLAGVAVNLAIGAALVLWAPEMFRLTGQISLGLGALNLIPLPPFDGAQVALILREMMTRR